jgi:hypothetical protein
LNSSTHYQGLSRPTRLKGDSNEAFDQEATQTLGAMTKLRRADESLVIAEVPLHRWRGQYGAVDRNAS